MSWYREADGTIVVEDGQELLKNHLNHGFLTREDGKVILLDYDLLWLCGKEHKKRRFFGRKDSETITWERPYKNAIKLMKKDNYDYGDCPRTSQNAGSGTSISAYARLTQTSTRRNVKKFLA